ncbi:MAG: precorrin-8X methylmutase [Nitrospirae bacterium]|nr:precorrin-8X methylmutase [Nitrospirota bacterium]
MKESILLLGHGSPKKDANKLDQMAAMLHTMLHAGCAENCVKVAYLQFAEPGIMDTIKDSVSRGAKKVILHPFFLSAGLHVTKDIPEMIDEARGLYPEVTFIYTEPLGIHEKLAHIVMERISAAEVLAPAAIEKRSFDILSAEADLSSIPADRLPIVQRVIHATADFDFKDTLMFHPDAVAAGLAAIKAGRDILTDVEMVRTGINKKHLGRWGGKVICSIQNTGAQGGGEQTSGVRSKEFGVRSAEFGVKTKAEIGIETALRENHNIGIIAIGNAPTALIKTIDLLANSELRTPNSELLLIGVPVGFVKAVESKALLASQSFPFITALGRKGGTPVAVAIVNALLKMAEGGDT